MVGSRTYRPQPPLLSRVQVAPLLGLPRLPPASSWPLPPATGLGVRNPVRPVPLASHTAAPASLLAAHCPARRPPPTKERRKHARPSPPARFAAAELRRVLRPAEAESALAAEHRPAYCLQVRQPCAVLGARARRGRPDSASLVLMGNPPPAPVKGTAMQLWHGGAGRHTASACAVRALLGKSGASTLAGHTPHPCGRCCRS